MVPAIHLDEVCACNETDPETTTTAIAMAANQGTMANQSRSKGPNLSWTYPRIKANRWAAEIAMVRMGKACARPANRSETPENRMIGCRISGEPSIGWIR